MLERTQVFVDTSYLLASFYNSWDTGARAQLEIDLPEVVAILDQTIKNQLAQPVHRQFWYDGIPDSGPHRYQRSLRTEPGVLLREGQLIEWGDRRTQKAVDTRLVADMVTLAVRQQVSDMVLVSGDADMLPGVEAAVNAGVRVHLYGFGWDSMSSALRFACDSTTILDPREDFKDCMRLEILEGPLPPHVPQTPAQHHKPIGDAEPIEELGSTPVPDVRIAPPLANNTPVDTSTDDQESTAEDEAKNLISNSAENNPSSEEASEATNTEILVPPVDASPILSSSTSPSVDMSSPASKDASAHLMIETEQKHKNNGVIPRPVLETEQIEECRASATKDQDPEDPQPQKTAPTPAAPSYRSTVHTRYSATARFSRHGNHIKAEYQETINSLSEENSASIEDNNATHSSKLPSSEENSANDSGTRIPSPASMPRTTLTSIYSTSSIVSNDEDSSSTPLPTAPKPSMMAPRRKLRSRYVPFPNEVWTNAGTQTPYDVGQQYASWWYEHIATPEQRDDAHLLSGGGLPPNIDRPLLQFACETLHEYTLSENQRVSLRDGFHAGIRALLMNKTEE